MEQNYVTRKGADFWHLNRRFRAILVNNYPFIQANYTASQMDIDLVGLTENNVKLIRAWAFNQDSPATNTVGNFRYLVARGSNVIANPSFETNTTGWQLGTDFVRDTGGGHSGSSMITQNSTSGFDNFTTTNDATGLAVTPNTNYTFYMWIKVAVNSGLGPILEINSGDAFGDSLSTTGPISSTNGVWKRIFVNFNSGEHDKVWIRIFNNNGDVDANYDEFFLGTAAYMEWVESTFEAFDRALDRCRNAGIKMILPLVDNNGDNKEDYLKWNDAINGTTYYTPTTRSTTSVTGDGVSLATVVTTESHDYVTNDLVTIAGASPTGYNGTKRITVVNNKTFTYAIIAGLATTPTGTITATRAKAPYKFFDDANIRQIYKDFIDKLALRTNTINGIPYVDDDTIFSWELGNELRYDKNSDPNINTTTSLNLAALGGPGGWADVMSLYLKNNFPNHLVGYGDLGHTYNYVNGDSIYNGSFYGVDFQITGSLDNIDYLDWHFYPYNDSPTFTLKPYGQNLGYGLTASADGLSAQVRSFNNIAKVVVGKPMLVGEEGIDKRNAIVNPYISYPRYLHWKRMFSDFFDSDGDVFGLWHFTKLFDDNNYNITPDGIHTGGNANGNSNDDDSSVLDLIQSTALEIAATPTTIGINPGGAITR